jgi:hypothetical protein
MMDIKDNQLKDFMAKATLICPKCGHKQIGEIPTNSCIPFYICEGCGETISANKEDCCIFCSHADEQCPVGHKDRSKI